MPFVKGQGGRKLGAMNKITRTVKETVLAVFNELQEDQATSLKTFAISNQKEFYLIASRLIPTELTGSVKHIINVTDKEEFEDAEIVPEIIQDENLDEIPGIT